MQYGFYINQKALVEISKETGVKLDLKDGAIIEFMAQYSRTPSLTVKIVDGIPYFWFAYGYILEQCPLLEIESKEVLSRRLLNIAKTGILKKYYEAGESRRTFFAFGENYAKLISHLSHPDSKVAVDENISKTDESHPDSKVEAIPTQKSDYQYTNNQLSTSSKKDIENFSEDFEKDELEFFYPNPVYQQAVSKACPDMDTNDFEAELTKFKLHYLTNPPSNPDKTWFSWCQRANSDYQQAKAKAQIVQKSTELANQRIQDFHDKKMENIAKIGTSTGGKTNWNESEKIYQENLKQDREEVHKIEKLAENSQLDTTFKSTFDFDADQQAREKAQEQIHPLSREIVEKENQVLIESIKDKVANDQISISNYQITPSIFKAIMNSPEDVRIASLVGLEKRKLALETG